MNKRNILYVLLTLIFCNQSYAFTLDFPKDGSVKVVGRDLFIDSKQVSIWQIESKMSREDHAAFYAEQWKRNGNNFGVTTLKTETVVSKLYDNALYTAQVIQHFPHSIAVVSVSKEPSNSLKRIVRKIEDLPSPSGSEILNNIKAKDGAKYSNTLVLKNSRTISKNMNFYQTFIQKKGFSVEKAQVHPKRTLGVLLARKGPNEFNVTFERKNNQTFVTAIKVDTDI
ncbi:hypothetical protein [Pseudoalteromonas spongiae]|uniref:hypothetical protein n=1 Tax=Pseudoalteromonas spongiae TaxID=298657 RepID=UPI00110B55F1|nr:hypothetical protein [Pseudoalteromonas spongiae]TMO86414.1 hypothetical protein CWC15_06215 [Pseudoalteromonas spongiae]